jgi:hypothetical protein
LKTQAIADKLFYAFNGRFFGETRPEMMHTIYLNKSVDFINIPKVKPNYYEEEFQMLQKLSEEHPKVHFDRLPLCPMCLEKLDTNITGQ